MHTNPTLSADLADQTTHVVDRLIRERECKEITQLSRQHRWALERQGRFPKRIHLGQRSIAWRLSEVMSWLDSITASRAL